jgi:hypothetical protein
VYIEKDNGTLRPLARIFHRILVFFSRQMA